MALVASDPGMSPFELKRRVAVVHEQQRLPRRGRVAVPAVGRLPGSIELSAVGVRVTVEASSAESRPLERVSPVRPQPAVTLPAAGFDVSLLEGKTGLVMIEFDADPVRDGVTPLAASTGHESIQLTAMRVIVAIYTRG